MVDGDRDNLRLGFSGCGSLEGIGIIIGVILCVLQGCGVIDIGWFWATFPFWIPIALSVVLWGFAVVIALILVLIERTIDE